MRITLNASNRKPLVELMGGFTGSTPVYMRAPTYAYQAGCYIITRDGNIDAPDDTDPDELERLIHILIGEGYVPKERGLLESVDVGLTISLPLTKVNISNLKALLAAKGELIRRALKVESLPLETDEEKISFPWFSVMPEPDAVKAYTHFITALCQMSVEQKRIVTKEKPITNEKYEFRGLLLRLGFIGTEFKSERKILLQNLSGNSAWPTGAPQTADPAALSKGGAAE